MMSGDTLTVDNRIQMFCYYNTLAWEVLAVTVAGVLALATLPFVVINQLAGNVWYFIFSETLSVVFLAVGVWFMHHIRGYALRWVLLPGEDYYRGLQGWIDWIETGRYWPPPRTRGALTTRYMVLVAMLGGISFVISAVFFFWFVIK
jgi:hypothetical protein